MDCSIGFWVVLGAEGFSHFGVFGNAVFCLRFEQCERGGDFCAVACVEDVRDHGCGGDDVGDLSVRSRSLQTERDVFVGVCDADRVDVVVDAVDSGLDVLLHFHAIGVVQVVGVVELSLEIGFGVRRGAPELLLELAVRFCAVRERGQLATIEVTEHVYYEQLVLCVGVFGAEHRAEPRGFGDVWDFVRLVLYDCDVAVGMDGTRDVVRFDSERRVVVVRREAVVGDVLRVPDQVLVGFDRVAEMRWPDSQRFESKEIREGCVAVLIWW